jgi:hypothetical protein
VVDDAGAVEKDVDVADLGGDFLDVILRALMPSLPSSSATLFAFMSLAQTFAPSRANASAAARPMPWPAAVMKAVFPARRPAMEGRDYTSASHE